MNLKERIEHYVTVSSAELRFNENTMEYISYGTINLKLPLTIPLHKNDSIDDAYRILGETIIKKLMDSRGVKNDSYKHG